MLKSFFFFPVQSLILFFYYMSNNFIVDWSFCWCPDHLLHANLCRSMICQCLLDLLLFFSNVRSSTHFHLKSSFTQFASVMLWDKKKKKKPNNSYCSTLGASTICFSSVWFCTIPLYIHFPPMKIIYECWDERWSHSFFDKWFNSYVRILAI